MTKKEVNSDPRGALSHEEDNSELELSDEDILDAMGQIPGYLDISTEDFRSLYHLAHRHALERMFRHVRADRLMRTGIRPLHTETRLDEAARSLAEQKRKGLPVVDAHDRVIGMLTETDFLRRLGTETLSELLLRLIADKGRLSHRCRETGVDEAMTAPAVTVTEDAGFSEILNAFHAHSGRGMAVVDAAGRLRGMLLRKDFIVAHHLEVL